MLRRPHLCRLQMEADGRPGWGCQGPASPAQTRCGLIPALVTAPPPQLDTKTLQFARGGLSPLQAGLGPRRRVPHLEGWVDQGTHLGPLEPRRAGSSSFPPEKGDACAPPRSPGRGKDRMIRDVISLFSTSPDRILQRFPFSLLM